MQHLGLGGCIVHLAHLGGAAALVHQGGQACPGAHLSGAGGLAHGAHLGGVGVIVHYGGHGGYLGWVGVSKYQHCILPLFYLVPGIIPIPK